MKVRSLLLLTVLALVVRVLPAQSGLYHHWLGAPDADLTIVFIHGGPGYNGASFEADMAPRLVKQGYQVLVYDQRGSGRSEGMKGDFTYAEAVSDLLWLLDGRKVEDALLLGHSFGGSVAVEFAKAHPERTAGVVLVSAPLDFPACFRAIRGNCLWEMEGREDSAGIRSIQALARMDSTRLEYATTHFAYAMANGLYTPSETMKGAKKAYKALKKPEWAKWVRHSSFAPVQGFWEKEHYTTANRMGSLLEFPEDVPVAGIYGDEDGLFDEESLKALEEAIGSNNFYVLSLASHAVFLDDPYGFQDALGEFIATEVFEEE